MRDTAIVGHRNFAIEHDLAWPAQPTQMGAILIIDNGRKIDV
jgi:hypothetical protein